ncbi:MAG: hypothetical protein SVS85_02945, partial [Candidatus Nanohaloarchaea archaeon]|nr:hypothetical protein [Candidatus Nanohaloarchaea archaeon]
PEIPAVTDAVKVCEAVEEIKGDRSDCFGVLNKWDESSKGVNQSEVEDALEIPVVSRIPYDRELQDAIFDQLPVVQHRPYARSSLEYRKLAAWIADTDYEPPKLAPMKRIIDR